jgi:hypothetical protein
LGNNYQAYQNNEKFGYVFQYPRNTLQLNRGINPYTHRPVFSEIGLLTGLAESDWSWTPLVTDFDNDGLRDVIITNGFRKILLTKILWCIVLKWVLMLLLYCCWI